MKKKKKDSYLALKNSAGFIRKEIAKNVKIRHIPEVIIELDETLDKAQHLDSLLSK